MTRESKLSAKRLSAPSGSNQRLAKIIHNVLKTEKNKTTNYVS